MKKTLFGVLTVAAIFLTGNNASAQIKIGVFDIDAMVTAMPDYKLVDSFLNIFQRDTLTGEYQVYLSEYQRLDSTLKYVDTPGVKTGKVLLTKMKYDYDQKQQMVNLLVNWRDFAQRQYDIKKSQLSRVLYQQVTASYQRILKAKGYVLVLKPGSYEAGTKIDNIFISVAKDLKLTELPQQLLALGADPDAVEQPAGTNNSSKTGNH